jgi:hypothetical protein
MIDPFLYAIIVVLGTLYRIYSFFIPQKKGLEAEIIHLDKPDKKERLTYQDLPKEVYDAFLQLGTPTLMEATSTSGWYINLDAPHIKLLEVPKKEIGWGDHNLSDLRDDTYRFRFNGVGAKIIFKKDIYFISPFVHPYGIPLSEREMKTLFFQKISIKAYYPD